jgi:hypothetical protein
MQKTHPTQIQVHLSKDRASRSLDYRSEFALNVSGDLPNSHLMFCGEKPWSRDQCKRVAIWSIKCEWFRR